MKRLGSMLAGAVLGILAAVLLVGVRPAQASEGTATLGSTANNVRCYVGSVLINVDSYQIVVSCRNLLIPPATNRLFYRVWAKRIAPSTGGGALGGLVRNEYLSLGDISTGKLSARMREAFSEVIVTSEEEAQPRTPSLDRLIAAGSMHPLEIDLTPTPGGSQTTLSPAAQATITPSVTPTGTPQAASRPGSVVGTAIRVFLVVLGVIVIVAIVISILQRRSASS